jgi:hypothetical protein
MYARDDLAGRQLYLYGVLRIRMEDAVDDLRSRAQISNSITANG